MPCTGVPKLAAGHPVVTMMRQTSLLLLCVGCGVSTSILLWNDIRVANKRQQLAFAGDSSAAKRIILPCFKPLIRGLLLFNTSFAIAIAIAIALSFIKEGLDAHQVLIYFFFGLQTTYCITPVMLTQTSVSKKAFSNTFSIILPYWLLCTLFFALSCSFHNEEKALVFSLLFTLSATMPPLLLSIGILTKTISSRVQVGSRSNRNATELLLVYSLFFGIFMALEESGAVDRFSSDFTMVTLSFMINQIFPFALCRTLLADTKFWRGLGKHNRSGMDRNDTLRLSGVDVHRPTMELSIVSSSFQEMMADINELTVDFAYLYLGTLIGEGSTAKVFCGQFKRRPVAIKLSTPPEITEDVMDVFVTEARIAAMLRHKNIIEFVGICVRPPQIGMVFEFCDGGDLKSHLHKNTQQWTSRNKLKACLDASYAVNFLHSKRFMHRDIKSENFFVDKYLVVKLGDFGEATMIRNIESTVENRMTIVGTVAFMAPELVNGERYYTEAIDIYALGIMFWEIWMAEDPYDGMSTFEIYNHVKEGKRLPLPRDAPAEFITLLEKAWLSDAIARPNSKQLVQKMENILKSLPVCQDDKVLPVEEGDLSSTRNSSKNPMLKLLESTVVEMATR